MRAQNVGKQLPPLVGSGDAGAAGTGTAVVRLRSLVKRFHRADGTWVNAIDNTSLDVEEGEFMVLLGPSGCGKTTLLRCVAGLERPDGGDIEVMGRLVFSDKPETYVPPESRGISMIFQSYALWPHMTAYKNVEYPLTARRSQRPARSEVERRVMGALQLVGIGELGQQFPQHLSGGQQQRVALARALVGGSRLVLLDEPLSNVDAKIREQLRTEVRAMQRELGFSAIYVTHDQTEAMQLADRIAVINEGQVMQVGTPREIYQRPTSEYVAKFVGSANEALGTASKVEGSSTLVETPLGEMRVANRPSSEVPVGQRVAVLWRPESGRIVGQTPGSANTWDATVETVSFMGSHTEYQLRVQGNLFKHWSAASDGPGTGEVVRFSLEADELLMFGIPSTS